MLEKALALPEAKPKIRQGEEVDLILAWLYGKITTAQADAVTRSEPAKNRQAVQQRWVYHVSTILRRMVAYGLVRVEKVEKVEKRP